jgi:hypothetical protein
MRDLPGRTVQCLNPECPERGHWLRMGEDAQDARGNCGAQIQNVTPRLAPRFRMRPRLCASYRPTWPGH